MSNEETGYTSDTGGSPDSSEEHVSPWFSRLKPLLGEEVSPTRNRFMFNAAMLYIITELEGIPESELPSLMMDGFRMEKLTDKWDAVSLADFADKTAVIAASRHIKHILKLVEESDIEPDAKEKLKDDILKQNLIDTWNPDS